jgi:hypothetical protein
MHSFDFTGSIYWKYSETMNPGPTCVHVACADIAGLRAECLIDLGQDLVFQIFGGAI